MIIRPEQPGDAAAIRQLLEGAFGSAMEADLVERLRAAGDLVLALAADDGGVVGHVAFPRLTLVDGELRHPVVGLAPLAVAEPARRRGIGAALVIAGLSMLRRQRETLVFVLGEPAYYGRFGFEPAGGQFTSPYDGPYFQVLQLSPDTPLGGSVQYPPAFAELG
jgi:putative acetyltransferase